MAFIPPAQRYRLEEKEAKNTKVVKADPTSKSSNLKGGSNGKKPSDFGLHYDAVQVRKPGSFAGRQATLFSSKEVKEMMKAFINAKVKPVMQTLGAEITGGLMTEIMCKSDGGADKCDQNTKDLINTIGGHIGALFSYIPGLLLKMTESFIPTFRMVQSLQGQAATGVSGAGGKASASGDLAAFAFICPGPNAKVNKFLDEKVCFSTSQQDQASKRHSLCLCHHTAQVRSRTIYGCGTLCRERGIQGRFHDCRSD